MTSGIQPADLGFFSDAGQRRQPERGRARTGHHDARGEQAPGADGVARSAWRCVNRTTRRMSLTPEGELYLEHARRILGEIDDMEELLGVSQGHAARACCGSTRRWASGAATWRR